MKKRFILLAFLLLLPGLFRILNGNEINLLLLSKFFGAISLSSFCIIFILGCRSYILDKFFGSLSFSYRIHHYLTFIFFISTFLHVIFYGAIYFSLDWEFGLQSLLDMESVSVVSGWVSFLIVLILFFISYIQKWSHRLWLNIHRILILSFFISIVHFGSSFQSSGGWGNLVLALFLTFTLVVMFIHYFFPHYLRRYSNYIVEEVKVLNDQITEISLRPDLQPIQFEPGQFVYISIQCSKGCGVSHDFHPFTLDSSPLQPSCLRIAVRGIGDDTKKLIHIVPGNHAVVEGPYGNLLHGLKPQSRQLWIAGGIGVTPFVGYLRRWKSIIEHLPSESIILLLFLRTKSDHVFATDLEGIQGLKLLVLYDDLHGANSEILLKNNLPIDLCDREVVISGSTKMIKCFKNQFKQLGKRKIRTEEFDL